VFIILQVLQNYFLHFFSEKKKRTSGNDVLKDQIFFLAMILYIVLDDKKYSSARTVTGIPLR